MCAYADCGFLGFGITMKNELLDQKIAKQEERLKQLKAQKQAIEAREKGKNKKNKIVRTILDVKSCLVLCYLKIWKMKRRKQNTR